MLHCRVLNSIPKRHSIFVGHLRPLVWNPGGVFSLFSCKSLHKKLKPVIYIWGYAECTGNLISMSEGWPSYTSVILIVCTELYTGCTECPVLTEIRIFQNFSKTSYSQILCNQSQILKFCYMWSDRHGKANEQLCIADTLKLGMLQFVGFRGHHLHIVLHIYLFPSA
jgi:hypothetical protein